VNPSLTVAVGALAPSIEAEPGAGGIILGTDGLEPIIPAGAPEGGIAAATAFWNPSPKPVISANCKNIKRFATTRSTSADTTKAYFIFFS
jgi:hypothetical protein